MCFSLRKTQMQLALFVKKHILLFSRPACCGNLTWWNLKGLAELANLTVWSDFFLPTMGFMILLSGFWTVWRRKINIHITIFFQYVTSPTSILGIQPRTGPLQYFNNIKNHTNIKNSFTVHKRKIPKMTK